MRKILLSILFITGCSNPSPGDVRQKKVYSRCLKSSSSVGAGPAIGTKGGGLATTVSSVCVKNQIVYVTEKFQYNRWEIIKAELVEE